MTTTDAIAVPGFVGTLSELDLFLIALADGELLTGHVLTSGAGWGPELEVNIAMSSIGQDEIGHARRIYERVLGDRAVVERFVYERPAAEFRASPLARTYPDQWERLLVRQFLYETADAHRLRLLCGTGPELAGLFGEMTIEETYHLEFWLTWLQATLGTPEGPVRLQAAFDAIWPLATESFLPGTQDEVAGVLGVASADVASVRQEWVDEVRAICADAGISLSSDAAPIEPDGLMQMLTESRAVYETAPGSW